MIRSLNMNISMDKVIRAMSAALDLAQMSSRKNNDDTPIIERVSNINYSDHKFLNHSQRTAYIAIEIANYLNLSENEKKRIYLVALLHDIGAANSFKESHSSDVFIKKHCITGADITKNFPKFHDISKIILYHHENFNGSGVHGLKKDEIPIESQIVRISDSIELLYREDRETFKQKEVVRNWVKKKENIIFSKDIVDAFLAISSKDMFWLDMANIAFMDVVMNRVKPKLDLYLNLEELEIIAEIFANIIDDKSKFTATHSKGIAKLAYMVSTHIGYDEEKCIKMKISGLLHDIGKVAIPTNILDKKGKLTSEEFDIIKSHVYYTRIILDKIEDIPDISEWAYNHHEKLNGHGYPAGLTAKDLSEESRILAVCDIYQALTEDRPYRKGLKIDKTLSIMNDMVEQGFICEHAFENLKATIESSNKSDFEQL
jgi:putative nucleotidyltransferase with HDIG domain